MRLHVVEGTTDKVGRRGSRVVRGGRGRLVAVVGYIWVHWRSWGQSHCRSGGRRGWRFCADLLGASGLGL